MTGRRDRYQTLKKIFLAASRLPEEEREAYLDSECAEDPSLRDEVASLLAADDPEGSGATLPRMSNPPPDEQPRVIGSYELLDRIGEGGMGIVYRARQETPRRQVALKVLRSDALTTAMQRRFEYEAEILARLQHHGIAQIFEAGKAETDGRPRAFIAMELIAGLPLTEYAARHRLGTRARLELMEKVCEAVEHAHQKGVIHRDLKPGNILVDESGQPKILDFGIARVTESDVQVTTMNTTTGFLMGTLPYMSPEQASGRSDDIDTRSDVYALGVLAYEVLTGRHPIAVGESSIFEALRLIREQDPTPIREVNRTLQGDVETILVKALEKDRSRRYASASALAGDIRRFLDDQPIVARPPSAMYQLKKFARRNRALVIGVAATFGAVVLGLIVSLVQVAKTETARRSALAAQQEAEREARRANSINRFLLQDMLAAPDPWEEQGADVTVAEVLDRAAGRVAAAFGKDPDLEAEVRHTLGNSYYVRGLYDRAALHLDRALELRRTLMPEGQEKLAAVVFDRALVSLDRSRFKAAERGARESLSLYRKVHDHDALEIADAIQLIGRSLMARTRYPEAKPYLEEALEMRRRLVGDHHESVADGTAQLGELSLAIDDLETAEEQMGRALELNRTLHGEASPHVALAAGNLALVLSARGGPEDDERAESLFRGALKLLRETLGPDHVVTIRTARNLGVFLAQRSRFEESERLLRAEADRSLAVLGAAHRDTFQAKNSLAFLSHRMGRIDEARSLYAEVVEMSTEALGEHHRDTLIPLSNLATLERERRRYEEAIPLYRRCLAGFRETLGPDHETTLIVLRNCAETFLALENFAEADLVLQELLPYHRSLGEANDLTLGRALNTLGAWHLNANRAAEAEPYLVECRKICRLHLAADDWRTLDTESKLGACWQSLGRLEEAEPLLRNAHEVLSTMGRGRLREKRAALRRLADFFEATGRSEEAELLYE